MSDGNTAIQVSPVALEGEAMRIFNFLNGAANAIVERSNLAKEVGEMQAEIKQLRADCETFATAKDNLSERLGWTRNELSEVQTRCDELARGNEYKAQRIIDLESINANQRSIIESLVADRDKWVTKANDVEYQLLQTQDHLASAEKTLADIRHAMGWKDAEPKPEDVEGKDADVGAPTIDNMIEEQKTFLEAHDGHDIEPIDPAPYFPPSDVAEVKPEEETTPIYHDDSNRYF